jgi:nucleoside-diphosphate-sugar epimerase
MAAAAPDLSALRGQTALVTGRSALARALAAELLLCGAAVRSLDVDAQRDCPAGVTSLTGDVRSARDVAAAMTGCSLVFHTVRVGRRGPAALQRALIRDVNLQGTAVVLAAARALSVQRLCYTSDYAAAFDGKPLVRADESCDTVPRDAYGRSLALAERAVLAASCPELATCVLRCARVFGAGDASFFPVVAARALAGLHLLRIGSRGTLLDYLHVGNGVLGHLLAATVPRESMAGRRFILNDGAPTRAHRFLDPLLLALRRRPPLCTCPVWLALLAAYACVALSRVCWAVSLGARLPAPFLTPGEVLRAGGARTSDGRTSSFSSLASGSHAHLLLRRRCCSAGVPPLHRTPRRHGRGGDCGGGAAARDPGAAAGGALDGALSAGFVFRWNGFLTGWAAEGCECWRRSPGAAPCEDDSIAGLQQAA